MVTLFAKSPPGDRDIADWYHPIENFNAVLCRARRLGLYRDEHLVRRHSCIQKDQHCGINGMTVDSLRFNSKTFSTLDTVTIRSSVVSS